MAGLIDLLSAQLQIPKGLGVWEDIIRWFYSGIGDYGFTIILIAVLLKILMLPIDYFQRKATAKQMAQQERIAPQIAKLKEKYANDKNTLNQKTMELYKREGIGFGSCGIMVLYLFITCFVFFTLFAGMNNISSNAVKTQYEQLRYAYNNVEAQRGDETAEDFQKRQEQAVFDKYNEIKVNWLWIENIWRPDTTSSPIATFDSYASSIKLKNKTNEEKVKYQTEKEEYEKIMNPLREKVRSSNGYFILIILSAVVTFLSMTLSQSSIKKKEKKEIKPQDEGRILSAKGERENQKEQTASAPAIKFMKWILPIVMVLITLGYSSAFAIYIVTISGFSAIANYVFNLILRNKKDDLSKPNSKNKQRVIVQKPDYVRQ